MSLITDFMKPCVTMEKHRVPDGEGGYITVWTEGVAFDAAVVFDTSMESRIAEKQGVTSRYTVTAHKSIAFEYHDVFKRVSDGKVFRVTSDGDGVIVPEKSSIGPYMQVTAEEWELVT